MRSSLPRLLSAALLCTGLAGGLPRPASAGDWGPIRVRGRSVEPGTKTKFPAVEERSFAAAFVNSPIFVARGARAGHPLCITAAIHGDEINSIEIAYRVFDRIDPSRLSGTLVMLPMINADGIRSGNRYMPDRRDLNRAFPGSQNGSVTSLVARAVFDLVVEHCRTLIDLHTGSFSRTNEPQIRVGTAVPRALEVARRFGTGIIILGEGPKGSLRREASDAGVAALLYEAGEPLRFQPDETAAGVRGTESVMAWLGMIDGEVSTVPDASIYEKTGWVRVPQRAGGFFTPIASLAQQVSEGDLLGRVVDPLTDEQTEVRATRTGRVIGMAVPQIVLSGYALYHIGER